MEEVREDTDDPSHRRQRLTALDSSVRRLWEQGIDAPGKARQTERWRRRRGEEAKAASSSAVGVEVDDKAASFLREFCAMTGVDESVGVACLERAGWSLDAARGVYARDYVQRRRHRHCQTTHTTSPELEAATVEHAQRECNRHALQRKLLASNSRIASLQERIERLDLDSGCSQYVRVRVVAAAGLPKMDTFGCGDFYAVVRVVAKTGAVLGPAASSSSPQRTKVKSGTRAPTWNEEFEFDLADATTGAVAIIEVFDYDRLGNDDYVGKAEIALRSAGREQQPVEYTLLGRENVARGSVTVEVSQPPPPPPPPPPSRQIQQQRAAAAHCPPPRTTTAGNGTSVGVTGTFGSASSVGAVDREEAALHGTGRRFATNFSALLGLGRRDVEAEANNDGIPAPEQRASPSRRFTSSLNLSPKSPRRRTAPREKTLLRVDVKSASGLPRMDAFGTCDAFAALRLGQHSVQTAVKRGTLEPKWDESFDLKLDQMGLNDDPELAISVWDAGGQDLIGTASVHLSTLIAAPDAETRCRLVGRKSAAINNGTISLRATLEFDQTVVEDSDLRRRRRRKQREEPASSDEQPPRGAVLGGGGGGGASSSTEVVCARLRPPTAMSEAALAAKMHFNAGTGKWYDENGFVNPPPALHAQLGAHILAICVTLRMSDRCDSDEALRVAVSSRTSEEVLLGRLKWTGLMQTGNTWHDARRVEEWVWRQFCASRKNLNLTMGSIQDLLT